ncbi:MULTISPECIES: DEAD/DEAH box helicase [Cysteiniphilum]|uniref:ATP-dependent RNA helicase DeaD n=2 Tax=Cysteiniphilum TaxID=2056696 RepID=A0A8J2Z4M2_9GAMM|nr:MULTISPECIES: DEAD/DEAH box helicase [Cysteiniphilum]GGF98054.1 ATP-dependent RNA helicase DeaD [Cysteiniphilum litorale]
MSTENNESQELSFHNLGLNGKILSAIEAMGYQTPTPIQANTIPFVLQGRDVLGQAQTGTGKTAAFALPLLNNMDLSGNERMPQVLVLTPTRELAIQVAEAFESFSKNIAKLEVASIYGGQEYGRQIQALRRGVQVVVGTAGRVMDHMRKGTLKLDALKALVLDEADEMLRMGFIDDVKWVLSHTPEACQRLLFSATMPRDVLDIVNEYLREPCKVQIKTKAATAKTIHQRFLVVKGLSKLDALDRVLEVEDTDGVMVFVKTKTSTIEVADGLKARGHLAAAINGDMQQNQREYIIDQLKASKINILVATDVVARGLDVERISHVINYDLPQDNEAYVHRIGRTGRAGREGDAISLIYTRDLRQLRMLERVIRHTLEEMQLPSAKEITEKRVARFKHETAEIIRHKDLSKFKELMQEFATEYGAEADDMVAALAFLAQGDKKLFVKEIQVQESRRSERSDRFDRSERGGRGDRDGRRNDRDSRFSQRRDERGGRGDRDRGSRRSPDMDMTTYRIEVGRSDGVEPRNIVGAIANEAGINSRNIGHIKLFDQFSTVDLPSDTPKNVIEHLKKVWVAGKKLEIKEDKR